MLYRLNVLLQRSGYPPMVFAAMGGGFAYAFSLNLIVTSLPLRIEALGGSLVAVGTATTLYGLCSSLSRPFTGRLVDWRAGWVYLAGLAMMVFVPLAYAFAPALGALYVGRAFHGIALGAVSTAYRTIVANLGPEDRRGESMAMGGLTFPLALMVAPPVGEVIAQNLGMTANFLAATGMALLAFWMVWPLRRLGGGSVLAGRQYVGFRKLIQRPGLQAATLSAGLAGVIWGVLVAFVPLLGPGLGLTQTGLFFTIFSGTLFFLRVPAGRLSDRVGRLSMMLPAGVLMVLFCGALPWIRGASSALGVAFLLGLATTGLRSAAEGLVVDDTPREGRETGLALNFFGFDMGVGLGPLAVGALADAGGFALAFATLGAVGLACMAFVGWLGRHAGEDA